MYVNVRSSRLKLERSVLPAVTALQPFSDFVEQRSVDHIEKDVCSESHGAMLRMDLFFGRVSCSWGRRILAILEG